MLGLSLRAGTLALSNPVMITLSTLENALLIDEKLCSGLACAPGTLALSNPTQTLE